MAEQRGVDRFPVLFAEIAELQQPIDEKPQTPIRRQATGRGMRRVEQPGLGEIGHDVADGGGGKRQRQAAREGAAADRLTGFHILFDDLAKDSG
jgi:hypothetical protein